MGACIWSTAAAAGAAAPGYHACAGTAPPRSPACSANSESAQVRFDSRRRVGLLVALGVPSIRREMVFRRSSRSQSARRCVVITWMAPCRACRARGLCTVALPCFSSQDARGMLQTLCSLRRETEAHQEVGDDVLAQQGSVIGEGEGSHEHHMRPPILGYGQHMPCTNAGSAAVLALYLPPPCRASQPGT